MVLIDFQTPVFLYNKLDFLHWGLEKNWTLEDDSFWNDNNSDSSVIVPTVRKIKKKFIINDLSRYSRVSQLFQLRFPPSTSQSKTKQF